MKAAVSSINVFKRWPFFFPLQITSTVTVLSCFLANSEFRGVSYYSLKKKSATVWRARWGHVAGGWGSVDEERWEELRTTASWVTNDSPNKHELCRDNPRWSLLPWQASFRSYVRLLDCVVERSRGISPATCRWCYLDFFLCVFPSRRPFGQRMCGGCAWTVWKKSMCAD